MNWLPMSLSMYLLVACNSGTIDQTGNQGNNQKNQVVSSQNARIANVEETQSHNTTTAPSLNINVAIPEPIPNPIVDINSFFEGNLVREVGPIKFQDIPEFHYVFTVPQPNDVISEDPNTLISEKYSNGYSPLGRYLGYPETSVLFSSDEVINGFVAMGVQVIVHLNSDLKLFVDQLNNKTSDVYVIYRGKVIGYALTDPINPLSCTTRKDPRVQQMKAFPKNPDYLKGLIDPLLDHLVLDFHEQRHHGYVERYAFLRAKDDIEGTECNLGPAPVLTGFQYLYLDVFYPEGLDDILKPYILEGINVNISDIGGKKE